MYAITGVYTPACLLAASISVEAVTPPLVGLAYKERNNHFQSRWQPDGKSNSKLDALKLVRVQDLTVGRGWAGEDTCPYVATVVLPATAILAWLVSEQVIRNRSCIL